MHDFIKFYDCFCHSSCFNTYDWFYIKVWNNNIETYQLYIWLLGTFCDILAVCQNWVFYKRGPVFYKISSKYEFSIGRFLPIEWRIETPSLTFPLQKDKGVWSAGSDHKGMDLKALSGLLGNVRVQVDGNGGHHLCLRSHQRCCLPRRSPFLRWTCNWKVVQKCCLRHKYILNMFILNKSKIFSLVT